MKKWLFPVSLLLFALFLWNPSFCLCATFTDDFDDASITSSTWTVVYPSWDTVPINGTDLGYRGTDANSVEDDPAASAAGNSLIFPHENLKISVDFMILELNTDGEGEAGIFFSVYDASSDRSGDYRGYDVSVGISSQGSEMEIGEIGGDDSDLLEPGGS